MLRFKITIFVSTFFLMALTGVQCRGQQGINAVFDTTERDFGSIEEVNGPVTHIFTLENRGSENIVITKVSSSCGCAATKYDRNPIEPKAGTSIEVRFDPRDFSGPIRKSVSVAVSDGREQQVIHLFISADVIPRPLTVEDEYPLALADGLRVSGLHAPFGYIHHGTVRTDTLKLYNDSDKNISLGLNNAAGTGFLKAAAPDTMKPQERGLMTVTYDLRKAGSVYGMISDRIYITVNGRETNLPVNANAIVVDDFTGIDPATAPKLKMDPVYHSFGEVKKGEVLTKEITIVNTGLTPLIIRSISARRNMECDLKEGAVIKPGENVTAAVTMTVPKDAYGVVSGGVVIISNDPERPMREFRTVAEVPD